MTGVHRLTSSVFRNHALKETVLRSFYIENVKKINYRRLTTFSSFTFRKNVSPFASFSYSPVFSNFCKISKDSKVEVSDENAQKIFEDVEFQNILHDFARDFDVDEESSKILDDIRKEHELPEKKDSEPSMVVKETLDAYHSISKERYKEFDDVDSDVIYSIEEEQKEISQEDIYHIDKEYQSQTMAREAKRGVTGVYDIEELVEILQEEKLCDIAVIKIPQIYHYADYLVLANAKSFRHARAVSELVVKFYKTKKSKKDPFVKIEGEKLGSWKAIDMGNIVLHILLEDVRASYDIESLWLLDNVYDSGGHSLEDENLDVLQEQMAFLDSLKLNEETPQSEGPLS